MLSPDMNEGCCFSFCIIPFGSILLKLEFENKIIINYSVKRGYMEKIC